MAFFLPFSGHALTSQTTRNAIQGSAPYLTFDGGRTRAVDANGLLGITLSNGTKYTPSTNTSSSSAPIVLPAAGQSFADIRMFVPTNTNSVALSSLIGPPNNYWGDDDGDANVTATGSLSLSIVDKRGQSVSRSTVPEICKAPYKVKLSSSDGILSTRHGVPSSSNFNASSVTYFVSPKATPVVCFARPNLKFGSVERNGNIFNDFRGPYSMWYAGSGFLPQSTDPSRYGLNFPTTGANKLYFDLDIGGGGLLSWSSVSQGGITVSVSNSTATSVRVTLIGPYATKSRQNSSSPGHISKPTLPQTFELVGRDNRGNPVVKYGFTLKQWFVNRGFKKDNASNALSWCNSLGYRMPMIKDLTNAYYNHLGATPSSPGNHYMRYVGAGFFAEWGRMNDYSDTAFYSPWYWVMTPHGMRIVHSSDGVAPASFSSRSNLVLCAYP